MKNQPKTENRTNGGVAEDAKQNFCLKPPSTSKLISLAVKLCGPEKVRDNSNESFDSVYSVWAKAERYRDKRRAEQVRLLALQADAPEDDAKGDMTEAEVMKMVELHTPSHFRKRARQFFAISWKDRGRLTHLESSKDELRRNAGLKELTSGQKAQGMQLVVEDGEGRWHRSVAEVFRDWLREAKTEAGRVGPAVQNGKSLTEARKTHLQKAVNPKSVQP